MFNVQLTQMKEWLDRAVKISAARELKDPVRYVAADHPIELLPGVKARQGAIFEEKDEYH